MTDQEKAAYLRQLFGEFQKTAEKMQKEGFILFLVDDGISCFPNDLALRISKRTDF